MFAFGSGFEAVEHLVQGVSEPGEFVVAVLGDGQSYAGGAVGQGRGAAAVAFHRIQCCAGGAVAGVRGGDQGEAGGHAELGEEFAQGLVAVAAAQSRDGDHGVVVRQPDPLGLDPQGVRVERQQSSDVAMDGGAAGDGGDLGGGEQLLGAYEVAGLEDSPVGVQDLVRAAVRAARFASGPQISLQVVVVGGQIRVELLIQGVLDSHVDQGGRPAEDEGHGDGDGENQPHHDGQPVPSSQAPGAAAGPGRTVRPLAGRSLRWCPGGALRWCHDRVSSR